MKEFSCPVCLAIFDQEGTCPKCEAKLALKVQMVPRGRHPLPTQDPFGLPSATPRERGNFERVAIAVVITILIIAAVLFMFFLFAMGTMWTNAGCPATVESPVLFAPPTATP